jgi:hypothetical protein
VQGVVARQLRPIHSLQIRIQTVEQDPGGGVAADPQLVVVVVVAAQNLHAISDQQTGPAVMQG